MHRPRLGRYTLGSRFYDVLSGERFVYRLGRMAGLAAVRPQPGDRVLDLGCGTGLNFATVLAGIGPTGEIVGVDRSPDMLAQARKRVATHGWGSVTLVEADAGSLGPSAVGAGFDLVVATYSLSIVADYRRAHDAALELLRPGGRMLIVDLALPERQWRVLRPLARLACWTGGVDPFRAPWRLLDERFDGVGHRRLRGGHVHVAWGTKR